MGLAIEAGNDFRVGLPVGSSVHAVWSQDHLNLQKRLYALLDYACQVVEINHQE